jgi:hypothetical protein
MGWNDRLPEDPYIPPREYYQDREEYEAWLEYIDMRLAEEEEAGLTSQNLDPAMLSGQLQPSLLQRLWTRFTGNKHGQEKEDCQKNENQEHTVDQNTRLVQETRSGQEEESETLPF